MEHQNQDPPASPSPNPPSLAAADSPSPVSSGVVTDVVPSEQSVAERNDADYSAIKLEYQRALDAFQLGDHDKAMSLIKETCERYKDSALAHRAQATICIKIAEIMDDQTAKLLYLKRGTVSAQQAVSLSPNSVAFALFYANLLYQMVAEEQGYVLVAKECERALAIENPTDPAEESFQEEQKIPTAEGRISSVKQELKTLIEKANISSIYSWMKNFTDSNGEKLRLIPLRGPPLPEDTMGTNLAQTTWSDEIMKAIETPEEKRQEEIDVESFLSEVLADDLNVVYVD